MIKVLNAKIIDEVSGGATEIPITNPELLQKLGDLLEGVGKIDVERDEGVVISIKVGPGTRR